MISAILLAAGESKRMGKLKQLLPFGQQTVIESAIANLHAARIDELIVVLGSCAQQVAAQLAYAPVKLVTNENYHLGMTSSLQTGLAAINWQARAILIALVDQPHVPPSVIDQLINTYYQSGALIVKPQYQNSSGHPIIIDLACRAEILALNPDCGLHLVTRAHQHQTFYLAVDTPAVIEDIDTPEDYRRIVVQSGK
ncbi:MAG: nucleotidyltransferase family protein [Acidobacteriota bacterium]